MKLDDPSDEQNDIVITLKTKKSTNLRVNSVAVCKACNSYGRILNFVS